LALGLSPAGNTLSMLPYVISLGGGNRLIKLINGGISSTPISTVSDSILGWDVM